jgi:hypothetical protein
MTAYDYWQAVADRTLFRERWDGVWRAHKLDVLLSPGGGLPAPTHGAFAKIPLQVIYTTVFNLLDYTAGAVPVTVVLPGEDGVYEGADGGSPAHPVLDAPGSGPLAVLLSSRSIDSAAREEMVGAAGLPVGVQVRDHITNTDLNRVRGTSFL